MTDRDALSGSESIRPTPTHAPTPETPGAVNVAGGRPYLNPGTDPVSQRTYALIFNGLTKALTAEQWMPLSERSRVAAAIFDELRSGGVEVRLTSGLERLRAVAPTAGATDRRTGATLFDGIDWGRMRDLLAYALTHGGNLPPGALREVDRG